MPPPSSPGRRATGGGPRRGTKSRLRLPTGVLARGGVLKGISCRLRIELPESSWFYQLSMAHPGDSMRILNRAVLPGGLRRYDFVVASGDPRAWVAELRKMEGTVDISGTKLADGSALLTLVLNQLTLDPLFQRRGMVWRFPFPVHDGIAVAEVIAEYPDLLRTIEDLGRHEFRIHLENVGDETFANLDGPPGIERAEVPEPLWDPHEEYYSRVLTFGETGPRVGTGADRAGEIVGGRESTGDTGWGVGHLAVCRVGLTLPSRLWATLLSQKFPEAGMEIVGELVVDAQRTLIDLRIRASVPRDWPEEVRRLPGVLRVDPLGKSGATSTMRITFRSHPLYARFAYHNLIWRMPSPIKYGVLTMVIVGRDEDVRHMVEEWRGAGLSVTLESVRHQEEEPRTLLTPRQEEIFRKAMSSGYYDIPRRVTLSEIAQSMDMAVSSLSEILAVVEKKLLHRAEVTA